MNEMQNEQKQILGYVSNDPIVVSNELESESKTKESLLESFEAKQSEGQLGLGILNDQIQSVTKDILEKEAKVEEDAMYLDRISKNRPFEEYMKENELKLENVKR